MFHPRMCACVSVCGSFCEKQRIKFLPTTQTHPHTQREKKTIGFNEKSRKKSASAREMGENKDREREKEVSFMFTLNVFEWRG